MNAHNADWEVERASAERAFVAVRYALGHRRAQLLAGLADPCPSAHRLAEALGHTDRNRRARSLAAELKPIVEALDKTRVTCR